jgi:YD repeat-containing protein
MKAHMIRILAAALATAAIMTTSHAGAEEQKRLYDAAGRSIGTAVPYSDCSIRYFDERGRSVGTSSTSSSGTTTYYDARGNRTGTTAGPSPRRR